MCDVGQQVMVYGGKKLEGNKPQQKITQAERSQNGFTAQIALLQTKTPRKATAITQIAQTTLDPSKDHSISNFTKNENKRKLIMNHIKIAIMDIRQIIVDKIKKIAGCLSSRELLAM